jgi:Tfp pilus assembly protein PilV
MRENGFTLIESVLAIGLIGAGLIGLISLFGNLLSPALSADQSVIASNLAKEKIEQIIADRASKGYPTTLTTNYSDGQLSGAYNEFSRNVTINEVDPDDDNDSDDFLDPSPNSGYARITVVVAWGKRSVKLETLITNYTTP